MKFICIYLLIISFLNAGLINKILLVVNEEPITSYDVDVLMIQKNINKDEAIASLLSKVLYTQELKKHDIEVSDYEIESYMKQLAKANNIDFDKFKELITQKYGNFSIYENEIKNEITRQKLVNTLLVGQLRRPTNDDLMIYYNNNIDSFSTASKFDVIQYSTKNRESLVKLQNNLMLNLKDIKKEVLILSKDTINKELLYIFNNTKKGVFTPISNIQDIFISFYIKHKIDLKQLKFSEVKDKIFNILIKKQETKYLETFFYKLKLDANIRILD
jgi:hypothetical protein